MMAFLERRLGPARRRLVRRALRRARALALVAAVCAVVRFVPTPRDFEPLPGGEPRPDAPFADTPFLERMLEPFRGVAASVQWVRADAALRRGEEALGYARAESALRWAPHSSGGWIFLARHFVLDRAALERADGAAARAVWVHAGFDVLERGEALVRDPETIAFERGLLYSHFAAAEDPKPIGVATVRAAWLLAAEAFERARSLGERSAIEARDACRERAIEAGR